MDRLILMRHGKAERHAAQGGDFERALAERGRQDVALIASALASEGLSPDLVLVSAARRTRETWEAAAGAFPGATAEVLRNLYHAEAQEVLAAVREADAPAGTVMVVGHNPGLHDLSLRLAMGSPADPAELSKLRGRFPTATAAIFDIDASGAPRLARVFYASEHGGHGGE
ncbi:SixA phosphatase family protein [Caulobacter endophyticus]|uniref:Histidine phosphatase family protein n=1 Tax=Caulobacter endophyticus TaxID=2172652 RepID=A0A2T9JPU6_9CAUL|nr:histidine phosphatase family protein [Caulobacter endophyticus]PVM85714.1 histidine phosphatase family protein [Caulobacter endophyticus]